MRSRLHSYCGRDACMDGLVAVAPMPRRPRRYSGRGEVIPSHSHPLRRPSPPGHSHRTRSMVGWPSSARQIDRSPSHRIALLVGLRDEPNLGLFLVSGSSPKQPSQPFSSAQRFPVVSFLRPPSAHTPLTCPCFHRALSWTMDGGIDTGMGWGFHLDFCTLPAACASLLLQPFLPQGARYCPMQDSRDTFREA